MKMYGIQGNPVRVAIFLAEKGVEMDFVPVDLMAGEHRTPEFLARNPLAQVPVLELDDGTVITETQAICRYLERLYPQPCLMGATPLEEAHIEMWQRRLELNLYTAARAVFRHSVPALKALEPVQISAWAELNRPRVSEMLAVVDRQLAASTWVAGERFSVADITLLFCLQMTDRIGFPLAENGEHIRRWHQLARQRPSVVAVMGGC